MSLALSPLALSPIEIDSFWLPKASSEIAPEIDTGFYLVYWVSLLLFLLVVVGMAYFAWKYKRRTERDITSDIDHNTKLEIAWSVIPLLIVIGLFVVGLKGFIKAHVPPDEAFEVRVTAKKWLWQFTYPDGTVCTNEVAVPAGRPVRFVMSSEDVLHSFFVPEFRVKQDVVPGLYTTLWFQSDEPRDYALLCTEYCGTSHSDMIGTVKVMDEPKVAEWVEGGCDFVGPGGGDPVKMGEKKVKNSGCLTCHSLDGTRVQGPSFLGLYGKQETLADGTTVKVDENYIRESILNPGAKVVQGYPNAMPTFQGVLRDKDIDNVIAYIKTLK